MSGLLRVFTAQGCPACAEQKQALSRLPTAVPVEIIDCDEWPLFAELYRIEETPTLIGFVNGWEAFRVAGVHGPVALQKIFARLA